MTLPGVNTSPALAVPLADRRSGRISPRPMAQAVEGLLAAEGERCILWLPVALGAGVAVYFGLRSEPPAWLGLALLAVALPAFALLRRNALAAMLVGAAAAAALGFAVAQWRTAWLDGPRLIEPTRLTRVVGRVVDIEPVDRAMRLVLASVEADGLAPEDTPRRVRIRVRDGADAPQAGDLVALRAVLSPLPAPAMPGGFDFQRHAYFRELGAVGYAIGAPEVLRRGDPGGGLALRIAALRQDLHERIVAAFPPGDERATVASALITGKAGALPEETLQAMRDSGLAHLLSISGLHMAIVAGFAFLVVRGGLALVPPLALRCPIKKWAAVAALLAAFLYLLLAGATVPTQRSFLMLGLALLAVLAGRMVVSMRPVAWAAAAILLIAPESLVGASFQLSFAAVVALVAAYEVAADRRRRAIASGTAGDGAALVGKAGRYLGGVLLTSLVASLATTPFGAYHFSQVTAFGLVANMIAVPVTAFWVMPFGFAAMLLVPFGLEQLALAPMGWGIAVILWAAETVAGWPGAVWAVPPMPEAGLAAVTLGGAWLCLWRRRWRLLGLIPIALGLASPALNPLPDILVSDDGGLIAVRGTDGMLHVSTMRSDRFVRKAWRKRMAAPDVVAWPASGTSGDGRLRCDALGCIYAAAGHRVALPRAAGALQEDCAAVSAVFSQAGISRRARARACPDATLVRDRFDFRREGAHAAWLTPDDIIIETVAATRGIRPWVVSTDR